MRIAIHLDGLIVMLREDGVSRVYVGCPHTDPDPIRRRWRRDQATGVAASILSARIPVFSPLTHFYPLIKERPFFLDEWALLMDASFWRPLNESFIRNWADSLVIVGIPGWKQSRGLRHETDLSIELGHQVFLIGGENL